MAERHRFDWDAGNRLKCQKHGVSINEVEELFAADPITTPDRAHSQDEERYIAVGSTALGRTLFVVFTRRTDGATQLIRPVSARYMHRKEYIRYEQLWGTQGPKNDH